MRHLLALYKCKCANRIAIDLFVNCFPYLDYILYGLWIGLYGVIDYISLPN